MKLVVNDDALTDEFRVLKRADLRYDVARLQALLWRHGGGEFELWVLVLLSSLPVGSAASSTG